MYNSTNAATWLRSPPRIALRRNSTQRFVMYNATNAATWLWAPQRLVTRLRVLRRAATQLNDLFVTFRSFALRLSTRLVSARRDAPLRNSTICLLPRYLKRRSAAPLDSTQRFVCDVAPFRSASPRRATQRTSSQRNDLFITTQRRHALSQLDASRLAAFLRSPFQRNELKLN